MSGGLDGEQCTDRCEPCREGQFQSRAGQSSCDLPSWLCVRSGATMPITCAKGSFTSSRSARCDLCGSEYQDNLDKRVKSAAGTFRGGCKRMCHGVARTVAQSASRANGCIGVEPGFWSPTRRPAKPCPAVASALVVPSTQEFGVSQSSSHGAIHRDDQVEETVDKSAEA